MKQTAVEKAKQLIETFGKEYASKVIDEIIASNPHSNPLNTELYSSIDYWFEVKQAINKLKKK
jgi:hypothetical protein